MADHSLSCSVSLQRPQGALSVCSTVWGNSLSRTSSISKLSLERILGNAQVRAHTHRHAYSHNHTLNHAHGHTHKHTQKEAHTDARMKMRTQSHTRTHTHKQLHIQFVRKYKPSQIFYTKDAEREAIF